jgi:hypothetical protein
MKIVIDTNIFFRDFMLDGTEFRTLFSELPRLGYSLSIPKLVFDETVNKFYDEIKKIYDNARKIGISALQFSKFEKSKVFPENAKEIYQTYFTNTLKSLNPELVDYPEISHQEIVERALLKRKPFRNSDTGGYRDALIWETVLELAKKDEVSFISNNLKDFSDDSNQNLHQDLLDDIKNHSLKNVSWFASLQSFNETQIIPGLKNLDIIQDQLSNDCYERLSLPSFLEEQLIEHLGGEELDPSELYLPGEFESPRLSLVENVNGISDVNVKQLSSGELLISFSAEISCEFDVFIYKSDYYSLPDNIGVFIWDNDWNEWYVAGSISREVIIDLELTFEHENKNITSVNILSIYAQETE